MATLTLPRCEAVCHHRWPWHPHTAALHAGCMPTTNRRSPALLALSNDNKRKDKSSNRRFHGPKSRKRFSAGDNAPQTAVSHHLTFALHVSHRVANHFIGNWRERQRGHWNRHVVYDLLHAAPRCCPAQAACVQVNC